MCLVSLDDYVLVDEYFSIDGQVSNAVYDYDDYDDDDDS